MIELPRDPMKPILQETIPAGPEWGYQLKWDGVRLLSRVQDGQADLYSRTLLSKNSVYPEVARRLSSVPGQLILDGEAVVFDPVLQRPVFQKVLQRERTRTAAGIKQLTERGPVVYVLFDLLYASGEDLRTLPYTERHARLLDLFPEKSPDLFVSDLFHDGQALWHWVETNGWEGVVSKRLSSPYREGKKHKDWFKRKTAVTMDVDIVGITIREGVVASLVMSVSGVYSGRVSLRLNTESKRRIYDYVQSHPSDHRPFPALPADLKGETVLWTDKPFVCSVTGLEITSAGLLRHPMLNSLPTL
ncbi:ATP-dependent DNA ligase [Paenibacillus gansuensis]|uniref:DNA ligase n=1 Tax=Paenibacillus gansuensis TaxID=306542 RepID=A0ABW5PHG8_9BACL